MNKDKTILLHNISIVIKLIFHFLYFLYFHRPRNKLNTAYKVTKKKKTKIQTVIRLIRGLFDVFFIGTLLICKIAMLRRSCSNKLYCFVFLILLELYKINANIAPHKNAVLLLGKNILLFLFSKILLFQSFEMPNKIFKN